MLECIFSQISDLAMSKAFVNEDHVTEDDDSDDDRPALPPGKKNYITPQGAQRLQEELYNLKFKERPKVCSVVSWAAENGDRSENADYIYGKRRLREIDKKIRFISKRLDNVEIVDPRKVPHKDQVLFGATVTIRDEDGIEKTYSIVGIDEADAAKGKISWISPLANALFKAKEGDFITFRSPKGPREIEIVAINYNDIA